MKNIFLLSIAALLSFSCAPTNAQNSSKNSALTTKEYFDGQKITALNLNSMCQATVKQGSENSVKITCNEYLKDGLIVKLTNGELHISHKGNKGRDNREQRNYTIKAEITCSDLTSLKCNGMSKVELLGDKFNTTDIYITVNGMSKLNGAKINTDGSATITVNGMSEVTTPIASTKNMKLTINGMSTMNNSLSCGADMDIEVNGMSKVSANIDADGLVDAVASGMSTLNLTGKSKGLNVRSSGMSNVSTKNFNSAKTNISTKQ